LSDQWADQQRSGRRRISFRLLRYPRCGLCAGRRDQSDRSHRIRTHTGQDRVGSGIGMSMSNVGLTYNTARHRRAQPRQQHGFTLVEALVALVVLSIGLLGVAKLVMGAVHADDSAYMRGQATQLAYELLDQMRANRPGATAGFYANAGANNDCTGGA